jgi:hypothetical protein
MLGLLTHGRLLDRGNPAPQNLERDFRRFDFSLWESIALIDRDCRKRKATLGQLCEWRNAISHADVDRKRKAGRLVPRNMSLDACEKWRQSLAALASSIDVVVATQCQELGCPKPW